MLTVKLRMQKWNELAAVESEHLVKKQSDRMEAAKNEADSRIDLLQTKKVDWRDAPRGRGEGPAHFKKQSTDRRTQGQNDEITEFGINPTKLNDLNINRVNGVRLDNRTNLQNLQTAGQNAGGLGECSADVGLWSELQSTAGCSESATSLESSRRSKPSQPNALQPTSRVAVKQNHNSLALPNSDKFKSIKTTDSPGRPFESVKRHGHDFTRNALGQPQNAAAAASLNQRINQFGLFERTNQQVDLNPGHLARELPAQLRNQSDRLSDSTVKNLKKNNDRSDEILRIVGSDESATKRSNRTVKNFQRSVSDLSNVILRKSAVLENQSINQSNEPRHPLKLNLKNLEQKLDTPFGHAAGKILNLSITIIVMAID